MKLTKKQEAEILKVYHTYWDSYLKGDVEIMHPLLADEYTQVGSAEGEVFSNKKDAVQFLYDTIDQVAGKLEMRNRKTILEQLEDAVLLHEFCDLYALANNNWIFYSKFRASTLMQQKKEGWKIIHQHSSFPDTKAEDGQNIAIDKIAAENQQLREAIKRRTIELEQKNNELAVEAALQRVRTVAMSMSKPDNLLNIAESVFKELQGLGFNELRNAIIQTFVDDKKYFNDYDFSDVTGGWISRIPYTGHPIIEKFVKNIRTNNEAFVETVVSGKEMEEWKEFREANGEVNDPRLDGIQELFYYHYSIGEGDIGISTFSSISAEKQNLLKRFRNVFDLAYKRYIDITKAEAQAKEAQIETSLERVRAQAMAMRTPEELTGICEVLYAELHTLGFAEIRNAMINIHDDEKETFVNYDYSDEIGKSINHLHYNIHPLIEKQIKEIRNAEGFSETSYTGKDLEDMITFRKNIGEKDDPRINKAAALYYYFYSIGTGSIGISTFSIVAGEKLEVLERFRNVFTLAYQRYIDIAQAEGQAREAKIEAALERVRTRTMAMQKSTDLADTSALLFQQLNMLVPDLWTCGFVLCDRNKTVDEWWLSGGNGFMPDLILPNVGDPLHNNMYKAWLNDESYYEEVIEGEPLQQHYKWLMTIPSANAAFNAQRKAGIQQPVWQQLSCAYFSKGYLVVITEKPCGESSIFKRFAQVFEQTYTRFLDLQKAEAQAREVQIELALERVRARSMAMQHSVELQDTSLVLFEQLKELGEPAEQCTIGIIKESEAVVEISATLHGSKMQRTFRHKIDEPFVMSKIFKGWKAQQKTLLLEIKEDELQQYNQYRNELTGKETFPVKLLPGDRWIIHIAYFSKGMLALSTNEPRPAASLQLLERFAIVFEQTYTRFLDLEKAEAQAKEAQIETALERVRSRSMGMQKSEELKEVIKIVYQQMRLLNIHLDHAGFVVDYKPKADWHFWIADEQDIPSKISHPYFESVWANQFNEAKEKWTDFFATNLNFEEKNKFYNQLLSYVPGLTEASKKFYLSCPGLAASTVLLDNVGLYIENFSGIPYSNEENTTLMRFGKVFQQTYTRFLDLQKAEAHAIQAEEDLIKLQTEKKKAEDALTQLQVTQKQLIQSEKMASLGELTAGIAHEIQNPLNFVNNFSEVSNELIDEMKDEFKKGDTEEGFAIADDIKQNLEKILHHGKRADAIVKGMLQHSSSGSGKKEATDINKLADEYLRLAYHGLRAKDKSFNATMKTDYDETIGNINIIPQDIGRVILNLITNAFYATNEKVKLDFDIYEPIVTVTTKSLGTPSGDGGSIEIRVADNGNGIPQKVLDKIFQPFFTTKPTGQGTGLGLSLSYDIVKAHGGELKVETREGEGAEFIILLSV